MINWKTVLKVIENVVFVILLLIAFLVIVSFLPIKNNYKLYSVMSGSMEPTIGVGSLIISQPSSKYEVGDIITFRPNNATNQTTTHRVNSIDQSEDFIRYYTKGDANSSVDSNYVTKDKIVGKYLFQVPYLGYLIGYIKTLPGLILIIVVPASIIIFEEIKKIKNESKEIISRKREKAKKRKKNEN